MSISHVFFFFPLFFLFPSFLLFQFSCLSSKYDDFSCYYLQVAASFAVLWVYQCFVVKVHRGVVADELKSDLQVSHGEVWDRRSNSEIVA